MSQATLSDTPTWLLTDHAIERYRQRVNRVPYEVAVRQLQELISRSRFVAEFRGLHKYRHRKPELWRGPRVGRNRHSRGRANMAGDRRDRIRFVVATDPTTGVREVITVLSGARGGTH